MGTRPGDKSVAYTAMMDVVLLLISGASGAGKSTVREAIAADLEPEVTAVELRHLDPIPQTPTQEWRQRMAERALQRAIELAEHGWHLLLAGDPVAPGEMLAAPSAPMVDIAMCLLDIEHSQRERLRRRGDPEELPHVLSADGWDAMQWSRVTHMVGDRWRISVIDVSAMTRYEANQAALQWVTDALEGRAPVFRLR